MRQDKIVELGQRLRTAFINQNEQSNLAYKPQFISNNYKEVLIFLGMHLPPEISFRLIELSPVSLNFAKNDHIWYNFALQHLSKLSMEKIEAFFSEHNVQI